MGLWTALMHVHRLFFMSITYHSKYEAPRVMPFDKSIFVLLYVQTNCNKSANRTPK